MAKKAYGLSQIKENYSWRISMIRRFTTETKALVKSLGYPIDVIISQEQILQDSFALAKQRRRAFDPLSK